MNNSLQHIKVDIKCDLDCDHSNCIQYALNLIHKNIIVYTSTVYKSIELEFYDCSKNQKYSSADSNHNHSNTIVYSKTSPIDNYNFSSHQNLQEQKDNFTNNNNEYSSQHLAHNHKGNSGHNSTPGFKNFESNKEPNDIITTESIFSLNESNIDNLSLDSVKAHLLKAIKLLKQLPAANSADRSSTTYRTTHSLIPLDNRSPIPPAQDVLSWLIKEESSKQTRPSLQRSDTNSSLSSYHLANQSPISPMANHETSKRSASNLIPIMTTMPVKYLRRSSRDITSDSSQDNQIAPSPPPPRRPPMSPSLLRRHAANTKEPNYAMTEWDQHLQIIKDQEEAYETVTESPASSPKRAAETLERGYDTESTTSLDNPIAAFEAMANN